MQPLALDDILDIDAYEQIRPEYRARVIAHKKQRRVAVGPQVSLVFEDRETLRYQIQEMTRVERTTNPEKVQIELDVYNELVPGENELSATLFIEIPELDQIQPALDRLIGIDEHVALLVGNDDEPIPARFDDRQMEEDRISAVHYIRFSLSPTQAEAFRSGPPPRLRIDHEYYAHETILDGESRTSLAADLTGATPRLLDTDSVRRARAADPDTLLETDRVRARRLSAPGTPERIVVEPTQAGVTLEDADPALLSELFEVTRQQARDLRARAGSARVRLDLLAGDAGALRFEITALR
jgi:hypothetical protein